MTRTPRILFFADGGPLVGGGHVMRCLTLARALMTRGADCAFTAPPEIKGVLDAFSPTVGPHKVEALFAPGNDLEAQVRSTQRLAANWAPDWLVIDHYRLDARLEQGLHAPGRRIMMMDDLALRPRDCDLLLDPGYGRTEAAYRRLVPGWARVLAGPAYALVRPEFAEARMLAPERPQTVRRVLVMLGLTDFGGVSARVVKALLPVLEADAILDVAFGSGARSEGALKALGDPRIVLHVDAKHMAGLMSEAQIAIGAGGSSVWERACLGLPAVTVILAENQRALAQRLNADGLTLMVEAALPSFEASLTSAFGRLARDADLRGGMGAKLAGLCDGQGAERVAEAMLH